MQFEGTQGKYDLLMKQRDYLKRQIKELQLVQHNYEEMSGTLNWKTKLENDKKELNEVDHYKQTIV